MVFPLGEWLLLSIGLLAWVERPPFGIERSFRFLPLIWLGGWIVEHNLLFAPPWDWHFPRLFVLITLVVIAWGKAKQRRLSSIFLASLCLVVQDIFLLNEPGIFLYDQWIFALVFVAVAFVSGSNLWCMVLALGGGMLLSGVFTVFLFDGVVRYYIIPNPFLWHFSIGASLLIAILKKTFLLYKARKNLGMLEEGMVYRKDD